MNRRRKSTTGEDLQQLTDPMDEPRRPRKRQLLPRERPPQRRDGLYTGCIARFDVVHGIADEQRLPGLVAEALQRGQYGLGRGFVSRAGITADDGLEMRRDSDQLEAAPRQHVALARDDRQRMARAFERGEGLGHLVVATHEAVVVRELMLSIGTDQAVDLDVFGCVALEHCPQRNAHTREPLVIGGNWPLAPGEGMTHRSQDEPDGIDECAVEVEKHRGRTMRLRLLGSVGSHSQS